MEQTNTKEEVEAKVDELFDKFSGACIGYNYSVVVSTAIELLLSIVDEAMDDGGESFALQVKKMLQSATDCIEVEEEQDAPRIQLLN